MGDDEMKLNIIQLAKAIGVVLFATEIESAPYKMR